MRKSSGIGKRTSDLAAPRARPQEGVKLRNIISNKGFAAA